MKDSQKLEPTADFQRNQRIRHKGTKLFGTILSVDGEPSVPLSGPHITYTVRWDDEIEENLVCPTELEATS